MKKRTAAPSLPVGPRGYTSFDPRDPEREARITARQMMLSTARYRALGFREAIAPVTPLGLRSGARWWEMEAERDYGLADREKSAGYARNMRWLAECAAAGHVISYPLPAHLRPWTARAA